MKILSLLLCFTVVLGCTSKDVGIKESIAANAKEQLMFAGINYSVNNGVVTLTGNAPGEELKEKIVKRVQSIGGVKKLIDHISIGPVLLDSDFIVKRKVDSVLADYPQVEAQVKNGVVKLSGTIQKQNEEKLLKDIHHLPVAGIENGLAEK